MSQVEQCLCRAFEVLREMFGFFEPREMLRSFAARGVYGLKLV